MDRKRKYSNTKQPTETGRWTKQEHDKFIQGLVSYGKNWKKVEEVVGTRTAAQVRSHAQKFFNRLNREKKKMLNKNEPDVNASDTDSAHDEMEKVETELAAQHNEETPEQILTLIRKSSKQNKSVNMNNLIETFQCESKTLLQDIQKKKAAFTDEEPQQEIATLQRQNSQINLMANLLKACGDVTNRDEEDESYFFSLIKKYKKYICGSRFIQLVDYPAHNQLEQEMNKHHNDARSRKSSFNFVDNLHDDNQEHYQSLIKKIKGTDSTVTPTIVTPAPPSVPPAPIVTAPPTAAVPLGPPLPPPVASITTICENKPENPKENQPLVKGISESKIYVTQEELSLAHQPSKQSKSKRNSSTNLQTKPENTA